MLEQQDFKNRVVPLSFSTLVSLQEYDLEEPVCEEEPACETGKLNKSFCKGTMRIAYVGKNRNNTSISKETFEKAVPSMFNCPIVANYIEDEDKIGSHDCEWEVKDGKINVYNLTEPIGVIPESANHWYEEVVEDDGTIHEYLCTDILLWKRQRCFAHILEKGSVSESMEITIKDGEWNGLYYEIYDMYFTAFCLLETAAPCFESASIALFSIDESFKSKYQDMLKELSEYNQNNNERNKEDMSKENTTPEVVTNAEEEASVDNGSNFALTAKQLWGDAQSVLSKEIMDTEWGEMYRYYLLDIQDDELIVEDWEDWNVYGLKYSLDGDNIVIDFESKVRKKVVYADYEEGENPETNESYSVVYENFKEAYQGKVQELEDCNNELSEVKEKFEKATNELDVLQEENSKIKSEKYATEMSYTFGKFEQILGSNEQYKEYKNTVMENQEYSVEDVENHCYSLIGRYNLVQTQTKHIGIVEEPEIDKKKNAPYGGAFLND